MAETRNVSYETLEEPNRYEPGEVYFDNWEIVDDLGEGSFGHVYLLEMSDYGLTPLKSAMKVIRIPTNPGELSALAEAGFSEAEITAETERQVENAAQEIRTMVELQKHPNVVRCEGYRVYRYQGTDRWDILIRMEKLQALPDYFKAQKRDPGAADAVAVGLAIARALEACAAKGLLHRDIKPGNIFVDVNEFDGSVTYKLGDFGTARAAYGGSTAMSRQGTPLYMSPEMLREDAYDARTDVYSLGLVMYQLANNNRLPFYPQPGEPLRADAAESARKRRMRGEALPQPVHADAALTAILSKACAFRAEDRSTAAELRAALEAYIKGEHRQSAKKEEPADPPRKAPRSAEDPEKLYRQGEELLQRKDVNVAAAMLRAAAEQGHAAAQNSFGNCCFDGTGAPQSYAEAVKWYRKSAEQGCAAGQFSLGCCYQLGAGVLKDLGEAARWVRAAAEQDNAAAQNRLGWYYLNGFGVRQDHAKAEVWFRRAAAKGNAAAQSNLGWCYQNGFGVAKNYVTAVEWYRLAVAQGDSTAQNNLGYCYQNGLGVERDYVEALRLFRLAAEQGETNAINSIGFCYQNGQGVAKNEIEAVRWYRKAASKGNAWAQNNLGWCYQYGVGVEMDPAEAARLYGLAAAQGLATGQNNLGWCYQYGFGVNADPAEAARLYRQAAAQGNGNAQNQIGWFYHNGIGVARDYGEAVNWYRKAAAQGNVFGLTNLGWCLENGLGVKKDAVEAVRLYRQAAEKNHATAQNNLGACYYDGVGVARDYAEALKWYRKAAAQGQAMGIYNLGLCYYNGHGVEKNRDEAERLLNEAAAKGSEDARSFLKKHTELGKFR